MEPYGFVYLTECKINGKCYIGQRSFRKKGWENYLGSGKLLLKAIRKYGKENFVRTIIYISFMRDDLDAAERRIISFFNAVEDQNFYNLVPGGHGNSFGFKGKSHSIETRLRMKQAATGHPMSKRMIEIVTENFRRGSAKSAQTRRETGVQKGAFHVRAREVTINNIVYPTITEARRAGYSWSEVQAVLAGEVITFPAHRRFGGGKSVTIDGVLYPTITNAMHELGLSRKTVKTYILPTKADIILA
jgi:group I intron endonuclease